MEQTLDGKKARRALKSAVARGNAVPGSSEEWTRPARYRAERSNLAPAHEIASRARALALTLNYIRRLHRVRST